MTNLPEKAQQSEIVLYQTEDGKIKIQVRVQGATVWLSLNQNLCGLADELSVSEGTRNRFL